MPKQLTYEEAQHLLQMLKRSLVSYINAPDSREMVTFDVEGDSKNDLFSISIYCGKINRKKINYGARIKADNVFLLELHINATNRHLNPGESKPIVGSHWHIYKEGYETLFAYPATDIESDDFVENTILFLEKFNVIEKPEIYDQKQLF